MSEWETRHEGPARTYESGVSGGSVVRETRRAPDPQELVTAVGLPAPHPRVRWVDPKRAVQTLVAELKAYTSSDPGLGATRLYESVRRMGMRLRVQLDSPVRVVYSERSPDALARAAADQLGASDLVASTPLDRIVASTMGGPGVIADVVRKHGDDTPGKPFEIGLRLVELEWQGTRDPKLWNWVRVTSPAAPTAEDVAYTLYTDFGASSIEPRSDQAYQIVSVAPYFRIPATTARQISAAWVNAPAGLRDPYAIRGAIGATSVDALGLANSVIADDVALAQAPTANSAGAAHALERVAIQLDFLGRQLEPWHALHLLDGAIAFLATRRIQQSTPAGDLEHWAGAIAAQEKTLFAVTGELESVLDTLTKGGNSAADASSIAPIHDVVDAYARAAGLSHFAVDGAEALAAARRLRAGLPLALAVDRVRVARETAGTGAEMAELSKRSAELRGHAIRGEHIDGVEIERLSVDADEVAFRARLSSLETRLRDVDSAAEAAGLSAADFENGLSTVRGVVRHIRVEMIGWVGALDAAHQYQGPIHSLGAAASVLEQRRDAVRHAQGGLTGLDATLGLQDFFTRAQHEVRDETLRTAVVHLARDLAIMVVSAQIASGAVGVVRGVMTAREAMIAGEVIEASAGATLAYSAVEVGVQAGVWTLASGDPSARGFAENALAIGLAEIAMRPFAKLFESLGSAEAEVQTVRQLARAAGRAGVKLGAEVGVGMGAATAAHAITHFGKVEAATWDGWITQGLALVAGRYVHASTKGMHSRVESAAKELGRNAATVFERKVVTLEHRSASTKRETTPDEALELLARNHELLLEERSLYQSIVGEGASSPNLEAVDAQIGAVSPELADVPLRLSGLRPVAGKDIFEGTGPQVAKALRAAADMGFQVESRVDSKTAARTVRLNGREITIYEPDAPRDSATTREWADALATSHPHPMSPAEARTDTAAFTERRQAVDRMYDEAMHGERATPAGVSQERLQLAVKGDAITGERIPLTYGADPAEAAKLFTSSRARSRPFSSRKASPTPPSSSSAPGRPAGAPRPARPARHGARRAMRTSQSSATRCSHKLAHSMSRSTRRTSRVAVTRP